MGKPNVPRLDGVLHDAMHHVAHERPMNLEHGGWQYNPHLHRWEMTRHSWRGIVARWANSSEWTAAIEPVGSPGAQHVAPHLFTWQDTAQDWCAAAILAALQTRDDAFP